MNPPRINATTVALIAALACGGASGANAQPPDMLAPPMMPDLDNEIPQWRALPLAHVAPRVMAALLDPQHYALAPAWIAVGKKPATAAAGTLAMYNEIKEIVPVDSQKVLLVLGTEGETRALSNLVATLDKPRSVLEFRIVVAAVAPKAAATLGVRGLPAFADADGNSIAPSLPPTPFIGGANRDAIAQLAALVASGQAVMWGDTSLMAPQGFAASTALTMSAPLDLKLPQLAVKPNGAFRDVSALTLTPSNAANDTIALAMHSSRHLAWMPAPATDEPWLSLKTDEGSDTVVNVMAGETIALFGFPTDTFPTEATFTAEQIKASTSANIIMLIQTRIAA